MTPVGRGTPVVVDWAGRIGSQDGEAFHNLIGWHAHAVEVASLSGQHLGLDGPDRNRRHRPEGHPDGAPGSVHHKGERGDGDDHGVAGSDLEELLRSVQHRYPDGRYELTWNQGVALHSASELV